MARPLAAGMVALLWAGTVVALWAAPARDAVAARVGVDDHGPVHPQGIGPLIQQGEKLTGSGESGQGEFGNSAALSPDGDIALIGAPDDSGGVGAAWVFTRSGSSWTQQGAKLTGSGEIGKGSFGNSVALSSEGNVVLIGAPEDNNGVGAVWVFTRSGSVWTQGAKLTGRGEIGKGAFGDGVALSSDGRAALIGGGQDNDNVGAVWAFARLGSRWKQQGPKLTAGRASGHAGFGSRVALSSDGNTALIGGPEFGRSGAAWAFTRRRGSRWKQQGAKLTSDEKGTSIDFGNSLALSGTGNTALIAGSGADGELGAVWAFTRSGSAWTRQGPKLTAAGETGRGNFGESLALSSDGNIALIGAVMNSEPGRENVGAAWVFKRSHATWRQHGGKLTGRGASAEDELFGVSAALSSAGNTALIGSEGDDSDIGAAWVFQS